MIASLMCGSLHGVDAYRVDLEVDFRRQGMPGFTLVGLAEGAVREARERVLAALQSCGFRLPAARITVNLAPADRKKTGTAFDLPLAVALLAASGVLPPERASGWFMAGELALSGEIRPVPGVLPLAMLARSLNMKGFLAAPANSGEASVVRGLNVFAPRTLAEAVAFLAGQATLEQVEFNFASDDGMHLLDFADVKGQEHAKRAVEIAAAGAHNLLFIGPPGSGKTMLAQRIPSVLPPLSFEESLEVTKIYSVADKLEGRGLISRRPFRSPHHTVSDIALIGGGSQARPGEVCLAHEGVLFLDELPEYKRQALEVLRQPLEDGKVTVARAAHTLTYPACCMLVAAMNPCPCGYLTDARHTCTCSPQALERYRSKLSGPLLDRIDLHVEVPAVPYEDLRQGRAPQGSAAMRERILAARALQAKRYAQAPCRTNAALYGQWLETHCALNPAEHEFLGRAVKTLALSARAYTRILRIARTIADLEAAENINAAHLAEAVNCRALDRSRI